MRSVAGDATGPARPNSLLRCMRVPASEQTATRVVWPAFLTAAAGFALDAVGKSWAVATLSARGTVWIWRPWLAFRLLHNPGAMLGFASGYPQALTVVTAVAVLGLAYLLACSPGSRLRAFALALMLSGAAGNLASRLVSGAVVDFIQVRGWPGIFNPADVLLRTGVLLLVAATFAPHGRRATASGRSRP